MFFLLRVAFWLCVVLVLLPTGRSDQPTDGHQVSAVEAASAASATISDVRGFCDRQPDACAVGSQAAATLAQRVQAGARMVYEFLTEKLAKHDGATTGSTRAGRPNTGPGARPPQDTLTPVDIAPAWRGPRSDGNA